MENGSRITIIEQGEGCSRLNKVVEVDIGVKAELNHLRFFGADRKAHVLTQTFVRQATESVYREFAFTLNNEFVRNEFYISLEGEKAQVSLAGASLGEKNNIQDDTIFIAHLKPSCESRQVFKKVLKDGSTGVFQGKIFVSAEAQKTDGYQISKALLLGSESKFLTKPELEIYADDVICSHGSTCGAIDEESLFYLTSRGVSRNEATGMLVLAFLDEAIQEIADEKLALKVRNIFISQLEPNLE
jgi:Fe-S cluster assembly protein SufD